MNKKRFIKSALLAWIVFIGIDFLMHASILESLWAEEIQAIKSSVDLAILIPMGYLSFLFLTLLVGFVFVRIYTQQPKTASMFKFGVIFGGLYAISNLLAVYSYIEIPIKQLIFFNLTYWIEIIAVVYIFHTTYYASNIRKQIIIYTLIFIGLILSGIVIQNII